LFFFFFFFFFLFFFFFFFFFLFFFSFFFFFFFFFFPQKITDTILNICTAPVLNIPTNMINLAASVHTLTVHGANFAANDNTIHFLLLRDKSSTQFDCVSVEAISSSELLCYMPDILSESDSGSQLYMAVSSHGGFALGGGLPNVSGRKRATNDIPLDAWHPLGIITPSPVIITNGALVSITTYTDTLTIYGKNFDGSGETLAVVFDKIGNIEPTCTIISATDTEIVCELSNLVEGTLRAVVYSFQGPSEAADVASIAPGKSKWEVDQNIFTVLTCFGCIRHSCTDRVGCWNTNLCTDLWCCHTIWFPSVQSISQETIVKNVLAKSY